MQTFCLFQEAVFTDLTVVCFLQLLEGNFALFIKYVLGHRNDFQNILLVIMVSVYHSC